MVNTFSTRTFAVTLGTIPVFHSLKGLLVLLLSLALNVFRDTNRLNQGKSNSSWQGLMEHFKAVLFCIIIRALPIFSTIDDGIKAT